jgi:bifunctional non-homologous end joining protein LigD
LTNAPEVEVDGRRLKLSNLDKVLYPETGFTKGRVIDYYARVAPVLVEHLRDRPLTLKRYPNGVEGKFFFEKQSPSHRPDWVATAPIWSGHTSRTIDYTLANDRATIVWLANLAALELHPSLSRYEPLDRPTVLAFDLDPGPPADVITCGRVAVLVRELLAGVGLECFPKTSGSKGLQVYAPLNTPVTYEQTKPFAKAVAGLLERQHPDLVVSKMSKDLRPRKVLVDWSQNDRRKTTIAVYSLRARERPTVSTPITWDELEDAVAAGDAETLRFEAGTVLERIDEHGDLFAPVLDLQQELPALGG